MLSVRLVKKVKTNQIQHNTRKQACPQNTIALLHRLLDDNDKSLVVAQTTRG